MAGPRLILHHFGSKDALLAAVLVAIEQGFVQRAAGYAGDELSISLAMQRMWRETAAPATDLALRAMFEVWGQALLNPSRYAALLASLTEPWIELMRL